MRSSTVPARVSQSRSRYDAQSLVDAFPNARFHVYASEDIVWQAEGGGIARFRLHLVSGGWWEWVGVIWRELFHFGTPAVVLWGDAFCTWRTGKRKRLGSMLIKSLLPFRHVLLAGR